MRLRKEGWMSLLMLAIGVWAVLGARNWEFGARLFPLAIGLPVIVLSLIQLWIDFEHPSNTKRGQIQNSGGSSYLEDDLQVHQARLIKTFAWLFGLMVGSLIFGLTIAAPMFTVLYLLLESKEKWWLSISFGIATWAFIHLILVHQVHLTLPDPLVSFWY